MTKFEPMRKSHIEELVQIEEECFNSGFAKNTFERELENKIAFYTVAISDGRVAGYAGLWNICGSADIMNVGVRKSFRRKGIAEGMMEALEEYCRRNEIFEINLEVRMSNIPARQLYRKAGFEEIAVRRGYYDGKEDAVIMKKIITEDETQ